ncbi:MAG: YkgJ family cysteine cluster protein [Thermodesulfobacteriota bacterium]
MRHKDPRTSSDRLMTWDDAFDFKCGQEIGCFNSCCRDVTIFLNPADIGRLRTALGISSTEFLNRYTVGLVAEQTGIPAVVLKMTDAAGKPCPFVTDQGCSVYEARPYSCRMYPLDTDDGIEYRFIVDGTTCLGLNESSPVTVEQWRQSQGLSFYDDIDHNLKDVMHAEAVWEGKIADTRMQDMIFTALYDPDRFREFIFESSFLKKFVIDEDILEKIRSDDVALLYFAGEWLRFSLFGKRTILKFDADYLKEKKKEVISGKR